MSAVVGHRVRTVALIGAVAIVVGVGIPSMAVAQGTEITVVRDVDYRSIDGVTLAMDAYLPPGSGPHPAVIVIPGGKWVEGSKDDSTWLPTDLASLGFATFAVDYRPATTAPFPAALEDLQAAVRFVRSHSARFDVDPANVGAVGASAGGHLAALLATWGEGPTDEGARVRVAVSWSGPMDLERLLHNPREDLVQVVRTFLGCQASDPCLDQARAASPIEHIDPSDGALYMGNSTEEIIPLEQATSMAAALQRAGVPNQLVETIGRSHGLGAIHNDKFFTPAMAFLGTWIGGQGLNPPAPAASGGKSGSPQPNVGPPSGQKGGEQAPAARTPGTPWWAVVVVIVAAVAALISLLVSLALLRRVRREGVATMGSTRNDGDDVGSETSERSLTAGGTDRTE